MMAAAPPPPLWVPPKPAIIRPALHLNRHSRRALESELGIRLVPDLPDRPPPPWSEPSPVARRQAMPFAPGWRGVAPAAAPAVLTYVGSTPSTDDSASVTFTGSAIGTAAGDRLVVVAVASSGGSRSVDSLTINGNSAVLDTASATEQSQCGIFSLLVASGTTATIVVNTSSGSGNNRMAIGVYTITGWLSSSAYNAASTKSSGSSSLSVNVNVPANGIVIGAWASKATSTTTWTGVSSKDYDATTESNRHSHASQSGLALESGRSVQASGSSSWCALSVASYG